MNKYDRTLTFKEYLQVMEITGNDFEQFLRISLLSSIILYIWRVKIKGVNLNE